MPGKGNIGHTFELISAGVDYATLTCSTGVRAVQLWERGLPLVNTEEEAGNGKKPWRGLGYLGWASSHITVGRRLDGVVVRLSGSVAHQYWRTFFALSDRCSRLDLAVTGACDVAGFNVAHLSLREARAWKRKHDSRIKVGYQFSEPGGASFTLGSRSSEKYGRIYDKFAETGSPYQPGTWRWEVEYKGETSLALATTLFSEKDRSETVGRLTMAHFAEKGISIPFAASGGPWSFKKVAEKIDAERRLAWLENQVKPSVRQLVFEVGEKTVLDALGLWPDNALGQANLFEIREETKINGTG